jgi:tRNA(fMet)-specific endonuclease VapC
VLSRFEEYEAGEIGVSAITAAELYFGVSKSRHPAQNQQALGQFLLPLEISEFSLEFAVAYGDIQARLERQGTPIGPLDTLIAAHAVSLGVTLVTNNTREFARVPDLTLEDWVST